MSKTIAQKMGVKERARALLVNAPETAVASLQLPPLAFASEPEGEFDYILLFVKSQSEFADQFPRLKTHLSQTGNLWVSWPKGGQLQTDLSLTVIIRMGYDFGLVESTVLSVDATWSAIRFTHPKKGKIYRNSYGQLKDEDRH